MTDKSTKHKQDIILGPNRDYYVNVLMDYVRLNRYDSKFITNIFHRYINNNEPLSESQCNVFDLIVTKYKKQLKALGVNYKNILALPWKNPPISTNEIRNKSYFKYEDDELRLHFAFNKKMIDEIRTLIYDDAEVFLNKVSSSHLFTAQSKYDFLWDKENMYWHGKFNVHLFRALFDFAIKHNIHLDSSVTELIDHIKLTHTKEQWTPQLHLAHNNLYVNCIAETMNPIIDKYDFTDTSHSNIEKICNQFGLEPLNTYTEYESMLITIDQHYNYVYNTESNCNQVELYRYLKKFNKSVIFALLDTPLFNINKKNQNNFITQREMAGWEIPHVIIGSSKSKLKAVTDTKADFQEYNTVISTVDLETLIAFNKVLGYFALENKFIRIK